MVHQKRILLVSYIALFIGLFIALFASMYLFLKINLVYVWMIRSVIIVLSVIVLTKLLHLFVVRNKDMRSNFRNMFLVLYSLLFFFLVLEGIFMFIPRSHGVGYTLAHENWLFYYSRSTNKLYYRDKSLDVQEETYSKKVFVLGDSFTAGAGIKNNEDRFANLLESKLPSGYRVLNLGAPGSEPKGALRRLLEFPFKPNMLILQYYGDDIWAASAVGKRRFKGFAPYRKINRYLRPLFYHSYLLNYVYWQFPQADAAAFFDFQVSLYKDEKVMKEHLADLGKIVEHCRINNASLIVVLFPYLFDLESSRCFVAPIKRFFVERAIPVINVTSIVEDIPMRDRIVSHNDPHPSVLVHKLIAEAIYDTLITEGLVVLEQ